MNGNLNDLISCQRNIEYFFSCSLMNLGESNQGYVVYDTPGKERCN